MQVVLLIIYILLVSYTTIRILIDTVSTPKTLAYLLLIYLIPVIGIFIYYSFGINYRHRQSSSKGAQVQLEIDVPFQQEISNETEKLLGTYQDEIDNFTPMVHFLRGLGKEHLHHSYFKLLLNGEEKFPEVLKTLETAQHFIHMEYYD